MRASKTLGLCVFVAMTSCHQEAIKGEAQDKPERANHTDAGMKLLARHVPLVTLRAERISYGELAKQLSRLCGITVRYRNDGHASKGEPASVNFEKESVYAAVLGLCRERNLWVFKRTDKEIEFGEAARVRFRRQCAIGECLQTLERVSQCKIRAPQSIMERMCSLENELPWPEMISKLANSQGMIAITHDSQTISLVTRREFEKSMETELYLMPKLPLPIEYLNWIKDGGRFMGTIAEDMKAIRDFSAMYTLKGHLESLMTLEVSSQKPIGRIDIGPTPKNISGLIVTDMKDVRDKMRSVLSRVK